MRNWDASCAAAYAEDAPLVALCAATYEIMRRYWELAGRADEGDEDAATKCDRLKPVIERLLVQIAAIEPNTIDGRRAIYAVKYPDGSGDVLHDLDVITSWPGVWTGSIREMVIAESNRRLALWGWPWRPFDCSGPAA